MTNVTLKLDLLSPEYTPVSNRVTLPPVDLAALRAVFTEKEAEPAPKIEVAFDGPALPVALLDSTQAKLEQRIALIQIATNLAKQRLVIAALSNTLRALQAGKVLSREEIHPKLAALIPLSTGVKPSVSSLGFELQMQNDTYVKNDNFFLSCLYVYGERFGMQGRKKLAVRLQVITEEILATYPRDAEIQISGRQVLLKKATSGLANLHIRMNQTRQLEKAERKTEEKKD
jgi:hypothetical protein